MKNRILNIGLALLAMVFVVACSDDDFTGDSTMQASAPTLSVALVDFNNSETLVEDDSTYDFTVSISEPQIVNVVVYLEQTGGDATEGDDFTFPHTVTIPAGSTSASGTITILSDDLIEENESVEITIGTGNESNVAAVNSETVTFNIGNLEEGELMLNLSWSIDGATTDDTGTAISATDFADLRFLLVPDVTFTNSDIVAGADGGSFESFTIGDEVPDGEYYVVADFYAANENISRDISLELQFDQVGVINEDTYTFPAALNNGLGTCSLNYFVMAKVTKSGDNYTIEKVGTQSYDLIEYTAYPNGYDVMDVISAPDGWSSQIEAKEICGGLLITGINATWMFDVWGEEIQTEVPVNASVDANGNITIDSQYIFTTLWNEGLYDYTISGTGTYDAAAGTIKLEYNLDQEGFSPNADYWFPEGYMSTELFVAEVSQN